MNKMDKWRLIAAIIRIASSTTLLIFVWLNACWAVALCITLIFIRAELEDYRRLYQNKKGEK